MDILLISRLKQSGLNKFCSSATKMGINLITSKPNELVIQSNYNSINIYDKNNNQLKPHGVINWLLNPETAELDMAFSFNGIPIFNSYESLLNAKNKMLSTLIFQKNRIPHPKTLFSLSLPNKEQLPFRFPFVFKELGGYKGKGAMLLKNSKDFRALIKHPKNHYYLQEFIPNEMHDIRIIVVGNKVLGGYKRFAKKGEWRTGSMYASHREVITISDDLKLLALKATASLGLSISGVDIILDKTTNKLIVLEINGFPSITRFENVTGISVTDSIMEHVVKVVNKNG